MTADLLLGKIAADFAFPAAIVMKNSTVGDNKKLASECAGSIGVG